jgi:hypothetical protein
MSIYRKIFNFQRYKFNKKKSYSIMDRYIFVEYINKSGFNIA